MNGGSSVSYLACTPCVPLFCTLFSRGGNRRVFRHPGAGGDHFHCTVEPSPGHIRCRKFKNELRLIARIMFFVVTRSFSTEQNCTGDLGGTQIHPESQNRILKSFFRHICYSRFWGYAVCHQQIAKGAGRKRQKTSKSVNNFFLTLFGNFCTAPFFRPLLGASDVRKGILGWLLGFFLVSLLRALGCGEGEVLKNERKGVGVRTEKERRERQARGG